MKLCNIMIAHKRSNEKTPKKFPALLMRNKLNMYIVKIADGYSFPTYSFLLGYILAAQQIENRFAEKENAPFLKMHKPQIIYPRYVPDIHTR